MATSTGFSPTDWSGFEELRRSWGWYVGLGILLIVLGFLSIGYAVTATVASVIVFGWLMVIGGVFEAGHAFWRRRWSGFFVDLAIGILYAVVGAMLIVNPLAGAATLTLLIAMFLFISGIFRIVASLTNRFHNWGWLLLDGIVNVILGVMIWRQWPVSGLWVIGLFVGIEMLFNGWSMLMLGTLVHNLPAQSATAR